MLKLNRRKQTYKLNSIGDDQKIDLKWEDHAKIDLYKTIFPTS